MRPRDSPPRPEEIPLGPPPSKRGGGPRHPKPLWKRGRDFLDWRTRPLRGWLKHRVLGVFRWARAPRPLRLHVGSGRERLDGWLNVDLQTLVEVDVALDVTGPLFRRLFRDAEAIYAEHFVEHLDPEGALAFLANARAVLRPGGWIRLSTPNLDWVWETQYRPRQPGDRPEERVRAALAANRAFYAWEHRCLWNPELLRAALEASGFEEVRECRWGESELEIFRGIERHERYEDRDDLPHVIVVEARRGEARPGALAELRELFEKELLRYDKA